MKMVEILRVLLQMESGTFWVSTATRTVVRVSLLVPRGKLVKRKAVSVSDHSIQCLYVLHTLRVLTLE